MGIDLIHDMESDRYRRIIGLTFLFMLEYASPKRNLFSICETT
jgi:hypothetical protein